MRKTHLFSISLIALFLTGCSLYHINFEDVSNISYPAKSSVSQVVYLERVDRPHEVIGYVTVNTERRTPLKEVIEKLKPQAAILGGDAITNIELNASGFWKKPIISKVLGNAYIRANYRAQVVAFKKNP